MTGKRVRYLALVLGTASFLAGCTDSGSDNGPPRPANAGGRPSANDVEAPGTFQKTERGLWDGRPSLGGVWVAHPDVTLPQRVIIRNTDNGKSTVGALFRREQANPGPRFQLSSDAAEALGVLAGQPVQLNVVALAREEVEEAEPHISDESTETAAETAAPSGADQADAADVAAATTAAIAATAGEDGEPQPVAESCRPSSFGRKCRPAPVSAEAPVEATGAEPAAADGEMLGVEDMLEPQPVPEEQSPSSFGRRNRRAAEPAIAAGTAEAASGDVTTAPLDATDESAAAPAPAAPAGPALQNFVQAGTFSSEENAKSAAETMTSGGLPATIRRQRGGSGDYWIVLVGPATAQAEGNEMLEKVKSLGYPDAFFVRG